MKSAKLFFIANDKALKSTPIIKEEIFKNIGSNCIEIDQKYITNINLTRDSIEIRSLSGIIEEIRPSSSERIEITMFIKNKDINRDLLINKRIKIKTTPATPIFYVTEMRWDDESNLLHLAGIIE